MIRLARITAPLRELTSARPLLAGLLLSVLVIGMGASCGAGSGAGSGKRASSDSPSSDSPSSDSPSSDSPSSDSPSGDSPSGDSPSSSSPSWGSDTGSSSGQSAASSNPQWQAGLLERIPEAPFTVAYRGQREVEFHYEVAGAPLAVTFTEDVGSNGQGEYAVELLAFLQGGVPNTEFYSLQHSSRAGFIYQHRDFRIRDLARFHRFYGLTLLAEDVEIAGQTCVELRVERKQDAEVIHEVCIHIETGLILRWRQINVASGQLMSRVEYYEFELDGDTSDLLLSDFRFPGPELDPRDDHDEVAGFSVLRPGFLPDGFDSQRARLLEQQPRIGGGLSNWMLYTYDDGVEPMIFVVGEPCEPGEISPDFIEGGFRVGPWRLLHGELQGYPVILMGQSTEEELLLMLESSLPIR